MELRTIRQRAQAATTVKNVLLWVIVVAVLARVVRGHIGTPFEVVVFGVSLVGSAVLCGLIAVRYFLRCPRCGKHLSAAALYTANGKPIPDATCPKCGLKADEPA